MGILDRINETVQAKLNKLADTMENTDENLELSYERQVDFLKEVKRNLVDLVARRKQLQNQVSGSQTKLIKLTEQAQTAVNSGNDNLAKIALSQKATITKQIDSMNRTINDMLAEEEKLTEAEQKLAAKIENFRTMKEVLKVQVASSEAASKVKNGLSGLSGSIGDIDRAVERAQAKIDRNRAKDSAIKDLIDSGVLTDNSDPINQAEIDLAVESELAAMKSKKL
jgi:phage shock protein A